ncbi:MAG TPA: 50S ribosomal protein L30 [Verrucomicrobiae bacterium]|nr:50S ribosomal protein L30 [Verrucomicrobiae bacterium]
MKKHIAIKDNTKKLRLTLLKSVHGQLKMHRDNLRGLGLRRRHHTVELNVTPAVLGMVRETSWMLKVEEV